MKKMLTTVLFLVITANIIACWFTQENYDNAYFAGVNYYQSHINNLQSNLSLEDLQFKNRYKVSLPLTCWFKVSPRIYSVNGQITKYEMMIAKLYYKIIPQGSTGEQAKWRLANSIDMSNKKWKLNFSSPVKLFGNNNLTLNKIRTNGDNIKEGDTIVMVWYIRDNSPDSISNVEDIIEGNTEPNIIPNETDKGNITYGSPGNEYYPSYVMSVVYNGKKTMNR